MKKTVAAALVAAMLIVTVLPAVAAASGGAATVDAHVNQRIVVTPTTDGVTIKANVAWQLVIDTPEGPRVITGEPTAGQIVDLPDAVTTYWVVGD